LDWRIQSPKSNGAFVEPVDGDRGDAAFGCYPNKDLGRLPATAECRAPVAAPSVNAACLRSRASSTSLLPRSGVSPPSANRTHSCAYSSYFLSPEVATARPPRITRRTRQPLNELPSITQDRALGSRTREPWKPERCAFRARRTYAGRRQSVLDGGGGGVGLH
jgi:hypothetical protein